MITFSVFDVVFFTLLAIFSLRGFFKGFLKEIFSFIIWISSLGLAWGLRQFPIEFLNINSSILLAETFFFILFFIIFFVLLVLIFKAISFAFNPKTFISNIIGFFLGLFKFYIFTIILFLSADEYIIDKYWWNSSIVSPYIYNSSILIGNLIGEIPMEDLDNFTIEPERLIN